MAAADWFAHGRGALTLPLERALFGSDRNTHNADAGGGGTTRRIGINFFFSWANEPWERRWCAPQG